MTAANATVMLKKTQRVVHPYLSIFASTGAGMGMKRVSISLHESYADFVRFTNSLQAEWGKYIAKRDAFIVSLESDNVVRQFSFSPLVDYIGATSGLQHFHRDK